MTNKLKPSRIALAIGTTLSLGAAHAAEVGFIDGTTATLQARNYYFSRDFSDIVGPNQQSKAQEWAQGFILDVRSGYTEGTVGFGVDVLGQLGFKLDSGVSRVNTGLLPTGSDGNAADDFGRIGAALKARAEEAMTCHPVDGAPS